MPHCSKCGGELNPAVPVEDFAVDKREAIEYRDAKLRVGDLVCEVCMHIIMFPTLDKNRDPEDVDTVTDFYLE